MNDDDFPDDFDIEAEYERAVRDGTDGVFVENVPIEWPADPAVETGRRTGVDGVIAFARTLDSPSCKLDAVLPLWQRMTELVPAIEIATDRPPMWQIDVSGCEPWEQGAFDELMAVVRSLSCRGLPCDYCPHRAGAPS